MDEQDNIADIFKPGFLFDMKTVVSMRSQDNGAHTCSRRLKSDADMHKDTETKTMPSF